MCNFFYSKKIKTWFNTIRPSIKILVGQFIFALIPNLLLILLSIPSAKIITSLTIYDYTMAKLYLLIDFIIILLINISWFINGLLYSKQVKHIFISSQSYIYDKLILMSDDSLKTNSKEKLINIMSSSLYDCASYSNILIKQVAGYICALITLIIVFVSSYIVGFIILGITILIYILFIIVNNLISKTSFIIQDEKDKTCEIFSDIISGKDELFDLSQEPNLKNKYIEQNNQLSKLYKKLTVYDGVKYNGIKILWKAIVALGTLYFISQIQYNFLSLTTYLIIIPYLTETIDKFVSVFDNYYYLELTNISTLRIKTIYDIPEKDILFFGENITDNISGTITFSNVSIKNELSLQPYIEPFSLHINKKEFVIIKGERNCGKRHIFNLLKRDEKPLTGTIIIDNINIYDFDNNYYKRNISYTNNKPYFFDMSINENLKLINNNRKEINDAIKFFQLTDFINKLPLKLNTNLNKIDNELSPFYLFLLGLLRAYLTKSEIIMIYEFPSGLNKIEISILKSILMKLKKIKTILIFTALDIVDNLSDKIILIKNGKVSV